MSLDSTGTLQADITHDMSCDIMNSRVLSQQLFWCRVLCRGGKGEGCPRLKTSLEPGCTADAAHAHRTALTAGALQEGGGAAWRLQSGGGGAAWNLHCEEGGAAWRAQSGGGGAAPAWRRQCDKGEILQLDEGGGAAGQLLV